MIDPNSAARLAELLEQLVAAARAEQEHAAWFARRVALSAGRPDRLVQFSAQTRKWRIRRETAGANVRINSTAQSTLGEGGGALLNDARPELTDGYPFVYQGDIWGLADVGAVLTVEEWTTPGPHGR